MPCHATASRAASCTSSLTKPDFYLFLWSNSKIGFPYLLAHDPGGGVPATGGPARVACRSLAPAFVGHVPRQGRLPCCCASFSWGSGWASAPPGSSATLRLPGPLPSDSSAVSVMAVPSYAAVVSRSGALRNCSAPPSWVVAPAFVGSVPRTAVLPGSSALWVPRVFCQSKSSAVLSQSCQVGHGALTPCRAPQIRTPCLSAAVIAVPHHRHALPNVSRVLMRGGGVPPLLVATVVLTVRCATRPCQSPASQRPARFALVALLRQLDRIVRHASQLADYMFSSPRQVPLCASQAPCFAGLYS